MKKTVRVGIMILLAVIILCSCTAKVIEPDNTSVKNDNEVTEPKKVERNSSLNLYTIEAELNAADKLLKVKQIIKYVNNEDLELKELYFHVYPNAFKSKETAPFLFDDFDSAYPRGFEPGYTEVMSVSDKARAAEKLIYSFQGEGETIMKIELPSALLPNESIELEMEYVVHIPSAGERFGYGDSNFNLGNWYPIAAVYDERDGWNLDKYYPIGDPFYSDTSDYIVSIKAPAKYIIAASGNLTNEAVEEDLKTWTFEAYSMRDFAFIANNDFEMLKQSVDGTVIKSYYYKEHSIRGKKALQIAVKSMQIFNEKFGKYPYPTYSVVETEFPSGMEYPGLVYISDEYYNSVSNEEWFSVVIVHETAHQWWYSLVGNDQIDEAWLDEGFASYSEKIYDEKYIGEKKANEKYSRNKRIMESDIGQQPVVRPLDRFVDWSDYGPIAYTKGSLVLDELRALVGDDKFFEILKAYFEEFKYEIATTKDFIDVSERVNGADMDDFFDYWLYAK